MKMFYTLLGLSVCVTTLLIGNAYSGLTRHPAPAVVQPITPAALVRATVLIAGSEGQGSGFVVTRAGRSIVWTAAHVVGPDKTVSVFRVSGSGAVVGKVILSDDIADLALVEIPPQPGQGISFSEDSQPPAVGTQVCHVGCFWGIRFPESFSTGVVSAVGRLEDSTGSTPYDQVSCAAYPGSSGGGVYLLNGQCIGVLVRQAAANLNIIIPVRVLRAWARLNRVEWAI